MSLAQVLGEVDRRVFGVLLEKSLAQPTYYPMTLSAIVAACNQKSNRDPVMHVDEDAVYDALERLRAGGLASKVLAGLSARVDRFKHEAKEFFGWEKPERAIMTELMLRGPQSIGELCTRCSRMVPFPDKEAVASVLETLERAEPPLVRALPKTAGRAAVRYAHLLYPEGEEPAIEAAPVVAPPAVREQYAPPTGPSGASVGGPVPAVAGASSEEARELREQVEAMQGEMADLHESLAELRRRFESLESQLL